MDFLLRFVPPCILHHFTGLYCPGCGGTRAFVALTHGQFLKSLYYHPLVLYTVVCLAWYLIKQVTIAISRGKINIPMPDPKILIGLAAVIVIVNCLVRNILYIGWGTTIY